MKQPLNVIPTPWHVKAEEFRSRYVPVLVCILVAAVSLVLWRHQIHGFGLSGVAEGSRSLVASSHSGIIQQLYIQPYQKVKQGDPMATIQPVDPRVQLEVLRAELQVAQMRAQPSLAEQNSLDYERIRIELLRHKAIVALAKVNLERTEKDVRRNEPLYRDKLVSEEIYDLSVKTRDAYRSEVEETTKAIAEIESRLTRLRNLGDPDSTESNQQLHALAGRLDQVVLAAATNLAPITLFAPKTGMISGLSRCQGEYVMDGEPLLTIQSLESDRIVGYLRQPYIVDPQVGMKVEIVTRSRKRHKFMSEIVQVGAQTEPITNALAFYRPGDLMDYGLPIVVGVPKNEEIRPGELVNILFRSSSEATSPANGSLQTNHLPDRFLGSL